MLCLLHGLSSGLRNFNTIETANKVLREKNAQNLLEIERLKALSANRVHEEKKPARDHGSEELVRATKELSEVKAEFEKLKIKHEQTKEAASNLKETVGKLKKALAAKSAPALEGQPIEEKG